MELLTPEINYILPLLIAFFVAFIIAIIYIISKLGWARLARHYAYKVPFEGTRVGIIAPSINGVQYRNSVVLKYNAEGFFLHPVFVFKLFHPPLFIPWKEITEIQDQKTFFFAFKKLYIGNPIVATISLPDQTCKTFAKFLPPVMSIIL